VIDSYASIVFEGQPKIIPIGELTFLVGMLHQVCATRLTLRNVPKKKRRESRTAGPAPTMVKLLAVGFSSTKARC
jgi:hypothetical protein